MYRKELKITEFIANLLDNKFKIFGIRFGIDPLLGLIPGIGDLIPIIFSLYLINLAKKMNLPEKEIGKMATYLIVDILIGGIPILGDTADFFIKANHRSWEILKKYKQLDDVIDGEIVEDRTT